MNKYDDTMMTCVYYKIYQIEETDDSDNITPSLIHVSLHKYKNDEC